MDDTLWMGVRLMVAKLIGSSTHWIFAKVGRPFQLKLKVDRERTPVRHPYLIREVFLSVDPLVANFLGATDLWFQTGLVAAPG